MKKENLIIFRRGLRSPFESVETSSKRANEPNGLNEERNYIFIFSPASDVVKFYVYEWHSASRRRKINFLMVWIITFRPAS